MKRDPLFFRFFKELPTCFFHLVGRPESDAQRFQLEAIEYKATSVRLDGVFKPLRPEVDPAYIWEAQFYLSETLYANLMTKVGRFLEHGDPKQDWVAVVIYANRALEQKNLRPYRCLLDSEQLTRIYLDELPPASPDQFEMGILELIAAKPDSALEKAQTMVPRLRKAKLPKQFQQMMIQFIETVIVHQFPNWSREEVEKMLQVTDIRQTRVYQEAHEEGREQGRGEEREEMARRLLEKKRPLAEIAEVTGLTPAQIRKLKKTRSKE